MKYCSILFFWAMCIAQINAQNVELLAGPMPAYSEIREAAIWLQTTGPAEVTIHFYPFGKPDSVREIQLLTDPDKANTVTFHLSDLKKGTIYQYDLEIDDKPVLQNEDLSFQTQTLWQYRDDEELPEFTLALGSCSYISDSADDRSGKPYGGEYQIFDAIAQKDPYAMLWLGDNTYFRVPDWNSRAGIYRRHSHTRSLPELQKLLRSTHHYAIWDDHDYGPNDANRSFVNKTWSQEAHFDFWPSAYALHPDLNGITGQARLFDTELFFLDNRWNRTDPDRPTTEETILGREQLDWFIEALQFSRARFKLVLIGGQVLSDYAAYENYARYEKERQEIIDRIEAEEIEGVIFLTGDRHSTELSSVELTDGRQILDLTCSPLTSTSYDHSAEPNNNRVEGTHYGERNFGLLHFEGQGNERQLRIEICDNTGKMVWEKVYSIENLTSK